MNESSLICATPASTGSPEDAKAVLEWEFPLVGPRVQIRPLRDTDLEAFHAYRSDPDVGRYQGWSAPSLQEAARFLRDMAGVTAPLREQWVQLAIALREGDRLIGDIGLYLDDQGATAQIGYTCAPAYQRQGLCSESVSLVVASLQRYTCCEELLATIDSRNLAGERLLLRLGFDARDATPSPTADDGVFDVTYALRLRARFGCADQV